MDSTCSLLHAKTGSRVSVRDRGKWQPYPDLSNHVKAARPSLLYSPALNKSIIASFPWRIARVQSMVAV